MIVKMSIVTRNPQAAFGGNIARLAHDHEDAFEVVLEVPSIHIRRRHDLRHCHFRLEFGFRQKRLANCIYRYINSYDKMVVHVDLFGTLKGGTFYIDQGIT